MHPAADSAGEGMEERVAPLPAAAVLTVWGASGSAPAAGACRCRWGGETVCFELRAEGAAPDAPSLMIDMGSGARDAGRAMTARCEAAGVAPRAVALLSHLHLDHVWGAPFFDPFYRAGSDIELRCGLYDDPEAFEADMRRLIAPPFFPIEPLTFGGARFSTFPVGAVFEAAGFRVTALPLHHPGGCMGFRIAGAGWSIAVIGDHEHGDPTADSNALALAEGADLVIFDGAYDDAEYPAHEGWGHSTWQRGLAFAAEAGAGQVLIHHHLPERTDAQLDAMATKVRETTNSADLAKQGVRWRLGKGGAAEL
ncbi:MBL fold metallo-hydrolase [Rhodovulum sp. DZ06]|uniref:MBL fold metallo-hydrolase n=1 Tax=Rhodovulum sp. DZ06 TaxID=3425126 RepID=UPI003D345005